jgi:glycosyltransferase involved in cell wall biosynthesis
MPAVSLIIATFNRGALLADTLRMALAQDCKDYEIIVVDQSDSVPDALRRFLFETRARLNYIRLSEPNLPAARNTGVRMAKGDILVFIDDDVVIEADYLSRHVRHYSDPAVGGVMGLTLTRDRDAEAALLYYTGLCEIHGPVGLDRTVTTPSLIGGNTSYRRQAFLSAGMSDEQFSGSAVGEDFDLSWRVGRLGSSLLLDPRIQLFHLEAAAGGCDNRNPVLQNQIRQQHLELHLYFFLKHWRHMRFSKIRRHLWSSYRGAAMNRRTVYAGVRAVAGGHMKWLRAMHGAWRRLVNGGRESRRGALAR